ncbi:hypothetical protein FSARC_3406 [Fusarium sarcochroum]|uniref:Zn(2)-C6 fungal-type domain-containing protein n=1 Tax=Fusarium sarcochroum TaxID=1208366 RepID=A0A8H4XCN0_9HYPO|nr:hypothetical protein FSARC_3406 [Fusarium sarcochroum]
MATTISENSDKTFKMRRREPLRIPNACQPCRSRKIKCDGGLPVQPASQRTKRKQTVRPKVSNRSYVSILPNSALDSQTYSSETTPISTLHTPAIASAVHQPTHEICSESENSTQQQENQDDDNTYCTAHGPFSNHVTAEITSKAGAVASTSANPVPFVDAPLFGDPNLDPPNNFQSSSIDLPPRAYADRLVGIYWKHIHIGEPVLDREDFFRDYDALYSRPDTSPSADRDLWLSILYIIFALAVQRQESTPSKTRDEEANLYFQHAWALARPERFLWDSGSIEQSTQDLDDSRSGDENCPKHIRLRQQVWASCVALDRCVSWSLGKTSTPYLIPLPNRTSLLSANVNDQQDNTSLVRKLELHEIGNHIQLAQTQAQNGLSTRLGISQLHQRDYHGTAMQLEESLNRWEDDLPSDWPLSNIPSVVDITTRAERYFLHLRLLHARIFLWRPMLARFCSGKSRADNGPATSNADRPDQHLRECAAHCVKTAQSITSLIIETLDSYEPMGILPWWYRVYYLHIAGTIFLAAMLKSHLYTTEVSKSWDSLLSALRQHEHLSSYIPRCVHTFTTLSTRILELQRPDSEMNILFPVGQDEGDSVITGVFHDMGVNFDDFLFDMGDTLDNDYYVG